MKFRLLLVLVLAVAAPLFAQDKPNSLGYVFQNVSFHVPDFDGNVKFWTAFGLHTIPAESTQRIAVFVCPNSTVQYRILEGKKNAGGSVGSSVDHIGFVVPDVPTAVKKWKAAGLEIEAGRNDQQVYLYTPEKVKIEILQDAGMKESIRPHHIHFFTSSPLETQAFYAKMFGAVPGKRATFDAADVPNMNLTFSKADGPVAPTNGRILNQIGFAVGLGEMPKVKKDLEAKGIVFDPALQGPAARPPARAFFIDPWGTEIELIEVDPSASSAGN